MSQQLIRGVDVASFQGRPASWKTAAGPVDWAAVKITELQPSGLRYVDPDAAPDWAGLRTDRRGRAAYMFGHPATSPTESVAFFLEELRPLGLADTDAIALDHETSDGRSPAAASAWALAVLQQLKHATGRRPVLYTFLDFAEEGNCQGLGEYPLWIADPSRPPGRPRVPKPWTTWAIHQYEINGAIDRDVANFPHTAAMAAALGKPKPSTTYPR